VARSQRRMEKRSEFRYRYSAFRPNDNGTKSQPDHPFLGQTNLLRSRYLRIDREKPKIRFSDIFIFNLVGGTVGIYRPVRLAGG
jgi:hypothetical protein